jgi:hypothetical protein
MTFQHLHTTIHHAGLHGKLSYELLISKFSKRKRKTLWSCCIVRILTTQVVQKFFGLLLSTNKTLCHADNSRFKCTQTYRFDNNKLRLVQPISKTMFLTNLCGVCVHFHWSQNIYSHPKYNLRTASI